MRRRRKEPLLALALAAATRAAFGHAVGNGFVNFDDDLYVTDNPHVRGGLTGPGVRWALTTTALANWHPLTLLSFQLDAELFGPDAWGFHLTNLLLHAANAAVLLLVLARWTGAAWRSALAAALFAWHPLHVESFAWVAERKDVLSTLLGLLTLAAYGRFAERPGWRRYAFVVVAFALGLAAKPMLVTLPAVLLLLDYWPLGRFSPHLTPRPPSLRGKGEKSAPPFPRREGGPG